MTRPRGARLRPGNALRSAAIVVAICAAASLVSAVASTSASVPLSAQPAAADPLSDAQAQARALRDTLDRLSAQVDIAHEDINRAEAALGSSVTGSVMATSAVDDLAAQQATVAAVATDRVRALYMDGGGLALYATVLEGSDPGDALARLQIVQSVVSSDQAAISVSHRALTSAQQTEQRLTAVAHRRTKLLTAAQAAEQRLAALVAERQRLLSEADATVRRLAAEQRAADAQAAAAAAARTLTSRGIGTATETPGTPYAVAAIAAARTKLGDPYVWGATGPDTFDCSGLVMWAYAQAGVSLPRVAHDQYFAAPQVPLAALLPGDLLFYAYDTTDTATIHHVSMYIGGGLMIEAPHTGAFVRIVPVPLDGFIGAVRPGLPVVPAQ